MVGECMICEKASSSDAFDSATDLAFTPPAAAVYTRAQKTVRHIVRHGWGLG